MSDMVERVARAMVVPLGHDPHADWERVFIGGYATPEPNDLASLCRDLARAAIEAMRGDVARIAYEAFGCSENAWHASDFAERSIDAALSPLTPENHHD